VQRKCRLGLSGDAVSAAALTNIIMASAGGTRCKVRCYLHVWQLLYIMQAQFLRTYYPDVDIPAELIREQVGIEAQLEDTLCAFDPLIGDLITSFHVSDGSRGRWSFMAFPMGESGRDLSRVLQIRWLDAVLTFV
jgi:hypothetical protein